MEDYQISRTEIATFQNHFASLTSSKEFTDVTLVCKDLKPVPLHRVILSASSLWFRELLPKLPDKSTIFLPNIDPLALGPLLAFIYGGEAKVAKNLLPSFMEAANILMIDGLSDKDRVEKVKRNPAMLENEQEDIKEVQNDPTDDDKDELLRTTSEDLEYESNVPDESTLSCVLCGFVTTAKSKNNRQSVLGRHNRKVHGEFTEDHLQKTKEEQTFTLDEDAKEPEHEVTDVNEGSFSESSESCKICGFKSVAKTKGNRRVVLKRHIDTVHGTKSEGMHMDESKSGEIIVL